MKTKPSNQELLNLFIASVAFSGAEAPETKHLEARVLARMKEPDTAEGEEDTVAKEALVMFCGVPDDPKLSGKSSPPPTPTPVPADDPSKCQCGATMFRGEDGIYRCINCSEPGPFRKKTPVCPKCGILMAHQGGKHYKCESCYKSVAA